jgi:Uma2 family endonuclease
MATVIEQRIPPLVAGDRLTRAEFLRRWELHPEIKNAELIGGIVYMASPVSVEHGDMDSVVGTWLGVFRSATPGLGSGHNTTTFLLQDTAQPDLNLRILHEYGGRSWVEGKFLSGTPEMLVEICRTSVAYDLHVKLDLYQAAEVPEYLAILLFEQEIRWHTLVNGSYQLIPADSDGLWRSRIFPGLWLDGNALLEGNLAQVLNRLQDGLNSPEYKAFAATLARQR